MVGQSRVNRLIHVYGLAIAEYLGPIITTWHALAQLPAYIVLGMIWIAPLRRFLIWMETGRWG